VGPEAAVFVDDQARFCAGSVAVGIRAAQIIRSGVSRAHRCGAQHIPPRPSAQPPGFLRVSVR